MEEVVDPAQWFAVQVKPRHEKAVSGILVYKGLQPFLPLCRARRKWSDRIQEVHVPLFPGYVFCKFDPSRRTPVLSTAGVFGIVRFGRDFAPVDPAEIGALQRLMRSGVPAEPWPRLEIGQEVEIDSGPLQGCKGILVEIKRRPRLVLSVSLLQRSVLVELDEDWVRNVKPRYSPAASTPVRSFA